MYDGTSLVLSGIDTSQLFVFVAVNYRNGGFGFIRSILEEHTRDRPERSDLLARRVQDYFPRRVGHVFV